jgi:Asp-tRNA(Asn)/Glu-tRNA(Gln) amidotransferase A subunit family amidase
MARIDGYAPDLHPPLFTSITFGGKDIGHVSGMPAGAGSAGLIAPERAACFNPFCKPYTVVLGKAAMTAFLFDHSVRSQEFGNSLEGSTSGPAAGTNGALLYDGARKTDLRLGGRAGVLWTPGLKFTSDAHASKRVNIFELSSVPAILAAEILFVTRLAGSCPGGVPGRSFGLNLESGNHISAVERLRAHSNRSQAFNKMLVLMKTIDSPMSPCIPTVAPKGPSCRGVPVFKTPFSVVGVPAMTMPASYSPESLPSGFQVAAHLWSDAQMLRLASSLKEEGFGQYPPPRFEEQFIHVQ